MKVCIDIHVLKRIKLTDFGDSLTSSSATMRLIFAVCEMSQQLLDGLPWNLVHIMPP